MTWKYFEWEGWRGHVGLAHEWMTMWTSCLFSFFELCSAQPVWPHRAAYTCEGSHMSRNKPIFFAVQEEVHIWMQQKKHLVEEEVLSDNNLIITHVWIFFFARCWEALLWKELRNGRPVIPSLTCPQWTVWPWVSQPNCLGFNLSICRLKGVELGGSNILLLCLLSTQKYFVLWLSLLPLLKDWGV